MERISRRAPASGQHRPTPRVCQESAILWSTRRACSRCRRARETEELTEHTPELDAAIAVPKHWYTRNAAQRDMSWPPLCASCGVCSFDWKSDVFYSDPTGGCVGREVYIRALACSSSTVSVTRSRYIYYTCTTLQIATFMANKETKHEFSYEYIRLLCAVISSFIYLVRACQPTQAGFI